MRATSLARRANRHAGGDRRRDTGRPFRAALFRANARFSCRIEDDWNDAGRWKIAKRNGAFSCRDALDALASLDRRARRRVRRGGTSPLSADSSEVKVSGAPESSPSYCRTTMVRRARLRFSPSSFPEAIPPPILAGIPTFGDAGAERYAYDGLQGAGDRISPEQSNRPAVACRPP
ncbi:hypothetical protein DF047_12700 [Burkholderia cenocepacia]|nr:hypothetical protein DF047_12700 [Burkholderia cenocepacia]